MRTTSGTVLGFGGNSAIIWSMLLAFISLPPTAGLGLHPVGRIPTESQSNAPTLVNSSQPAPHGSGREVRCLWALACTACLLRTPRSHPASCSFVISHVILLRHSACPVRQARPASVESRHAGSRSWPSCACPVAPPRALLGHRSILPARPGPSARRPYPR